MAERVPISEKVRGEDLRRLIERESEEPVTVLIELELPEPEIKTREIVRDGVSMHIPVEVVRPTGEQQRGRERLITQGRKLLSGRVISPPNWLESAGAFVATATPQRLVEIAASPVVKAIWPNRELRNYVF
jgi:hypothetical protein